MTEPGRDKPAARPAPTDQLARLLPRVGAFLTGFWLGYDYVGPAIVRALGLDKRGRHRPAPVPGHVIVVPPEQVGCECWCHQASDERIGG